MKHLDVEARTVVIFTNGGFPYKRTLFGFKGSYDTLDYSFRFFRTYKNAPSVVRGLMPDNPFYLFESH